MFITGENYVMNKSRNEEKIFLIVTSFVLKTFPLANHQFRLKNGTKSLLWFAVEIDWTFSISSGVSKWLPL